MEIKDLLKDLDETKKIEVFKKVSQHREFAQEMPFDHHIQNQRYVYFIERREMT